MAHKILLTSFKGGTGVSTCCVYLGIALAAAGERVLIADGDVRTSSATIIGGCRDLTVYTLADYEKGACRAKQTLVAHPAYSNLCFMPAMGLEDLSYANRAISDVDGLFDYVLLDKICPEKCQSALIVTEPFTPSVKSADCCRSSLIDGGITDIGLIVNKINGGQLLNGEILSAAEISVLLRLPLKAVITEDLNLSAGKCKPSTVKAFKTAAEFITGKREQIISETKGYSGVNGYFKRKIRSRI